MSERIVTYEGEEILRIAEDGTITVQPNVTVETVARILVEAMNQITFWRERAQQHIDLMRTFSEVHK